eukprot:403356298
MENNINGHHHKKSDDYEDFSAEHKVCWNGADDEQMQYQVLQQMYQMFVQANIVKAKDIKFQTDKRTQNFDLHKALGLRSVRFFSNFVQTRHVSVYLEQWIIDKMIKAKEVDQNLHFRIEDALPFNISNRDEMRAIQFLVTLGGDGTILYAAKQFHGDYIPPIISFSMGSLSYLCNFDFKEHEETITKILLTDYLGDKNKDPCLDLRMRLRVEVEGNPVRKVYKGGQLENYEEIDISNYHVINEIVLDRGPSPYCIQMEIYIDNQYFTTLVGDGLIISTPTGSTAYNLAAGGSIMQSNVPAISLTPLAPHSLSFRPLILPENIVIKLKKPKDGRSSAWVSLDGATRFELKEDESVIVRASANAVAFITNPCDNLTALWSQRLTKLLKWNARPQMKALKKQTDNNVPE